MAEVTIKAYSRRGKNGKIIQVRGYVRRVGRKGIISPKRTKEEPGEEFEKRVEEIASKKPTITKEELERRREWEKSFARVEADRKRLGMSREQYSHYLLRQKEQPTQNHTVSKRSKKHRNVFDKMEDRIAKFVEKFSNKKYKR